MQCKNGIDYDECENEGEKDYDGLCYNCAEEQYDKHMEHLIYNEPPLTVKERQEKAYKQKAGK